MNSYNRLLNRVRVLEHTVKNEGKQVGTLYHVCTLDAYLKYILPNDSLSASGNYINALYNGSNYISFTRDKYFLVKTSVTSVSGLFIQIVIDGDKLSNNYKIGPYNDMAFKRDKQSFIRRDEPQSEIKYREMEEVVKGPIKNLSKYIKEIRIDADRITDGGEVIKLSENLDKLNNVVFYNFIKHGAELKSLKSISNGASIELFADALVRGVPAGSYDDYVLSGYESDIKRAVRAGFNLDNLISYPPQTLLSYYTEYGNISVVKMLLEIGANPNSHNLDGTTPLYVAVENNKYEIAQLLISNGATVSSSIMHMTKNRKLLSLLKKNYTESNKSLLLNYL